VSPPPDRTLAVGYRGVRRRKTRGGGAGGDEAAARGRGLAPRGHGVEARIITGELLHPAARFSPVSAFLSPALSPFPSPAVSVGDEIGRAPPAGRRRCP
jgi:hypothetical protein